MQDNPSHGIWSKSEIWRCQGWLICRGMPQLSGADPGFMPGEGAKGMMTLYGMGMSDFLDTQTQICNFSWCLLPYYAWMVLNNHSRDTSVPYFCPWVEGTCAFGAGPSVPGVGARPNAPPPPGSAPGYFLPSPILKKGMSKLGGVSARAKSEKI